MLIRFILTSVFVILQVYGYGQKVIITEKFDSLKTPPKPDYSLISSWAAHPGKKDPSDTVVGVGQKKNLPEMSRTDVFFIHPTSYTNQPNIKNPWSGDITEDQLNKKTDDGSILYQASVFNQAGNVYAPRYRQAHYYSYLTEDTFSSIRAFDVAYMDVKVAFTYYLANYNKGNAIIIASHSQGTTHAIRLVKEFFDDKPLQGKLVCAYLVGMPVYESMFNTIKPCMDSAETGCYCTWRTYARGYYPKDYKKPLKVSVCTNPLTWKTDSVYASHKLNRGGILRDMKKVIPRLTDAQVMDGVLRINKPDIKGKIFLNITNYHIADYNLFYMNVRENALYRTKMYGNK